MIVLNSTILPDWSIAEEWLAWLRQEHIPLVMASGVFERHSLYQLLDQPDEQGPTYVLQLFAPSQENYQSYLLGYADLHHQRALARWGNRFVMYRTVMQRVD
jgi:Domain of unknown function (DUF4286)